MAHSFRKLQANFNKYSGVAYMWFLSSSIGDQFQLSFFTVNNKVNVYHLIGLFSKPVSPMDYTSGA